MPFDNTNFHDINEVSASGVEVGKLRVLSEALKGEMPRWKWNFRMTSDDRHLPACGTAGCALGLAGKIGLLTSLPSGFEISIAEFSMFGLSNEETAETFGLLPLYNVRDFDDITPAMVAAQLDRIIARETA